MPDLPRQHGASVRPQSSTRSWLGGVGDPARSVAVAAVTLGALAGLAPSAHAATATTQSRIDETLATMTSARTKAGHFRPAVINQVRAQYGEAGVARIRALEGHLASLKSLPLQERLSTVNDYFNELVIYTSDDTVAGGDRWQSLVETVARGRGDCEDYAVAKYTALRIAGVPESQMEILVGRAYTRQMHAVLLVHAPQGDVVLGNMTQGVRALAESELESPIFSFTSKKAFLWGTGGRVEFSPTRMSKAVEAFATMAPILK